MKYLGKDADMKSYVGSSYEEVEEKVKKDAAGRNILNVSYMPYQGQHRATVFYEKQTTQILNEDI